MKKDPKIDTHLIKELGVTVIRYYCGESADELGTLEYWKAAVYKLWRLMPFKRLFKGWIIHIYHRDRADLPDIIFDWDKKTPGNQPAQAVTYPAKTILTVYPDSYFDDGRDWQPETPRPVGKWIFFTRIVLHHEFGHWLAQKAGLWAHTSMSQLMRAAHARHYAIKDRYSDKENAMEPWSFASERFAEGLIPVMGPRPGKDRYNDEAKTPPELFTVYKLAYYLCRNRRKKECFNLQVYSDRIEWSEIRRYWFFWHEKRRYQLTHDFKLTEARK